MKITFRLIYNFIYFIFYFIFFLGGGGANLFVFKIGEVNQTVTQNLVNFIYQ